MSQPNQHEAQTADPLTEELVAYLDDELASAERLRVEERLAHDAEYRGRLERLRQAWSCLDELGHETVDDAFTRSTMEMVTVAASRDLAQQQRQLPAQRSARRVLLAALLLVCVLAGALAAAALLPNDNGRLVANLSAIDRVDQYMQIDDIAYLRQLHEAGLFANEADAEGETLSNTVVPLNLPPADTDLAARRAWVERVSPSDKAVLAEKLRRFDALSDEERGRVLKLERAVSQDPQMDALQQTLERYHEWLKGLSPGERNDLAALTPVARLARVKEILKNQRSHAERARWARAEQERRAAKLDPSVSQADLEAILSWLEGYLLANKDAILQRVRTTDRTRFEKHLESLPPRQQAAMLAFAWQRTQAFSGAKRVAPLEEADLRDLAQQLSSQARARLEGSPPEERRSLIRSWVAAAVRTRLALLQPSARILLNSSGEELEAFFAEELSSQQREYLLSLPREEMDRELRRMYVQGNPGADGSRPPRPPDGYDGPRGDGDWQHGRRPDGLRPWSKLEPHEPFGRPPGSRPRFGPRGKREGGGPPPPDGFGRPPRDQDHPAPGTDPFGGGRPKPPTDDRFPGPSPSRPGAPPTDEPR